MQVGVPSAVGADTGVTEDGQQEFISEVVLAKCSGAHWTDPPPVNSRDIGVAEIRVFRNWPTVRTVASGGQRETQETPLEFVVYPEGSDEAARQEAREAFHAHNRAVYERLREKGFGSG